MKLTNSPSGQIDWTGIIKTARFFAVSIGGVMLTVLLEQVLKEFLPSVDLGAYAWVRPVLVIGASTMLELLRRFMTDYSDNA